MQILITAGKIEHDVTGPLFVGPVFQLNPVFWWLFDPLDTRYDLKLDGQRVVNLLSVTGDVYRTKMQLLCSFCNEKIISSTLCFYDMFYFVFAHLRRRHLFFI